MSSNVEHVIFDFDGVIVDSERRKFSDLQEILKEQGFVLTNSQFRDFIGKKRGTFLKEIGIRERERIMKKVHQKDDDNTDLALVEGVLTFLKFLRKKKY